MKNLNEAEYLTQSSTTETEPEATDLRLEQASTALEPFAQTELSEQPPADLSETSEAEFDDEAVLNSKMASGIGKRNRAEPDHEADANRVAVAVDKMGRWLGFSTKPTQEDLIEVATVGKDKVLVRPSSITVRSESGAVTVYHEGTRPEKPSLGRGGWTAVGLLIVFLPVVAALGLLAFNLNQSLEGTTRNLLNVQRQEDTSVGTTLSDALNDPDTRVIRLKSLEGLPKPGGITLLQPPLANWTLSFRSLQKLDQGQIYVTWFAKTHQVIPIANPDNYLYITSFNGTISGSGASTIQYAGVYSNHEPKDYTEMIVTIESAALKEYKQPSAPIYFSAPLPDNHL